MCLCTQQQPPPKDLPGQYRVTPAKFLAKINRRGQRQALRAGAVGAVAPIRSRQTRPPSPALDPGWLEITQPTHMLRQIGTRSRCALRILAHNLVANAYATPDQTSSISCNRGPSVPLEVSNMHERVEVSVS